MPIQQASTLPLNEQQHHQKYMSQALELARQGRFSCDPNPMVGALIVKDGQILGQGFHQTAGEGHAEVNAIADALARHQDISQSELYVTLEPCSHTGRTPPCCDAIEAHQFKCIIVACADPNPLVKGQGIARLSQQYPIILGVLETSALELNTAFFYRMRTGKPWVQIKMGASLDGKIALKNGASQWITGTAARQDVHRLRLEASAVITGRGTLMVDNARLNAREDMLGFKPTRQPLRVILDRHFQTKKTVLAQCSAQPTLIAVATNTDASTSSNTDQIDSTQTALECVQLPCKDNMIELSHLLTLLGKKSINKALVEAGPTLAGQFLAQDLANEIVIFLAPLFLGPDAKSIFDLPLLETLPHTRHWSFHSVELIGEKPQQDLKIVLRRKSI